MRTITFQSVLWGSARLLGLDPARDLNSARAATLTEYANQRVREGWQFDYWPEWTPTEKRYFRDVYSASENVTATTERYHIGSGNYYQALRAQSPAAQAPATYSAGAWTENSAYWAVCRTTYDASDWAAGTVYSVTNGAPTQVRDPLTGLQYQVHTAHTAGATIDLTKMGLLTAFQRYVAFEQTGQTAIGEAPPDGITARDPRVFPENPAVVPFEVVREGLLVHPRSSAPTVVWVRFRQRPPEFNSTAYSAAANVIVGDVRYYATTGECYRALQAQSPAAELPTNPAYWVKMDFPAILAGFVKRATAADALRDQKQTDRADDLLARAQQELSDTRDRELASQGQYDRVEVQTYGS